MEVPPVVRVAVVETTTAFTISENKETTCYPMRTTAILASGLHDQRFS